MAKIMLVEDDNNLREIYEARLLAEGYEIVTAKDGEEALATAVKERPDLIISDVMMPKISGFDMLDILRTTPETKDAKVIMMTALSQAEDKERADKLGADRYLVKSQVTLEDVAKVAREVLEGENGPKPDAAAATAPADSPAAQDIAVAPAPSTDPAATDDNPAPQDATPADATAPADDTNASPTATDDTGATTPQPATPATEATAADTPQAAVPATDPTTVAAAPSIPGDPYTDLSEMVEDEQTKVASQIQNFADKPPTAESEQVAAPAPEAAVAQASPEPKDTAAEAGETKADAAPVPDTPSEDNVTPVTVINPDQAAGADTAPQPPQADTAPRQDPGHVINPSEDTDAKPSNDQPPADPGNIAL
jgi:CheY-like chemotaxis protein